MIDTLQTIAALLTLLDLNVIPGPPDQDTPLGKVIQSTLLQIAKSPRESNRLKLLYKNLLEIKNYDEVLFQHYKSELKKHKSFDSYWGDRMEIYTAASLARKKVDFTLGKPPNEADFIIEKLQIESTSVHSARSLKYSPEYLVARKISEKTKKAYCKNSTALFIDITNLNYEYLRMNKALDNSVIMRKAEEALLNSCFGAVLLFSYVLSDEYKTLYIKLHSENIDSQLKKFLDHNYPNQQIALVYFSVPKLG